MLQNKEYWKDRDEDDLNINHPHRETLLGLLDGLDFKSILEVGCGCGSNLSLIKKEYPDVRLAGIDINRSSIIKAKENLKDVQLIVGDVNDLPFKDKSFDVVLSDAVLMYISPEEIKKVKFEMLRVARKALILVEFHSEGLSSLGDTMFGHWARNYKELFKDYDVQLTKVRNWTERNWQTVGYFITIKL